MSWGAVAQFFSGGFDCAMRDRSLCAGSRKETIQQSATVVGPSAAAHIERGPTPDSKWSARFSDRHAGEPLGFQHFGSTQDSPPEFKPMPDDHRGQPSPYDRISDGTTMDTPVPLTHENAYACSYRPYRLPSPVSSTDTLPPRQFPSPESIPDSGHGLQAKIKHCHCGSGMGSCGSLGGSATCDQHRLDWDLPPDLFKRLGIFLSRDRAVQMKILSGEAQWGNSLRRSTLSSLSSSFLKACMEDRWEDASRLWTALHVCDKQDFLLAYSVDFVNMMA